MTSSTEVSGNNIPSLDPGGSPPGHRETGEYGVVPNPGYNEGTLGHPAG